MRLRQAKALRVADPCCPLCKLWEPCAKAKETDFPADVAYVLLKLTCERFERHRLRQNKDYFNTSGLEPESLSQS